MKTIIFTYITASLIFLYGIFAQRVLANPATPNPGIELFPSLLITEVDFKNNQHDKIVIKVVDDMNNGKGESIKGLSLKDDSIFFKLNKDIYIRSGEKIIITFKNKTEEIIPVENGIQLNLVDNGLTGTTEQIILMHNENILDAFCWTNTNPTSSEILELEDLFNKQAWNSNNITSCFSSDAVNSNEPVIRKDLQDTNSKDDWKIKVDNAKTTTKELDNQQEAQQENLNPAICGEDVFVSEFLPNPLGKDSNNEWIEIMNSSGSKCSLYGWQVDDREGGSDPYTITSLELIPSGGYILLPSWKTKINLNNSEDSVRLFNESKEKIDEISYKDSPSNKSYMLDPDTNEFLWTSNPTPLMENVLVETTKPKKEIKKEKTKIPNGTLSNELQITEIFPNPKGQDKSFEWIEIYNKSDSSVELGNWTLEVNSKSYIFKNTTLKEKDYLLIHDKDFGFSLKNSDGLITLRDFNKNIISSVQYDNAVEAQSFMKITNIRNGTSMETWQWSDNPTPGEKNDIIYSYTGVINEFNALSGKLKLLINQDQPNEETLDISVLISGEELAEYSFKDGSIIEVTVKKENSAWILKDYSIIEDSPKKPRTDESDGLIYILLSSIPPLGFIGYSAVKKFGLIKIV